jgi:mRNA interferase RelE/StbE
VEKYKVVLKPSTVKDIEAVPRKKERQQIIKCIGLLADDPRPPGCTKLSGYDRYRIRQGSYRIVYGIEDNELVVYVIKVGHRKDVYRGISESVESYAT